MNLNLPEVEANETNAVLMAESQTACRLGPRIERCEFEALLQRAMEILNARDLKVMLRKTA